MAQRVKNSATGSVKAGGAGVAPLPADASAGDVVGLLSALPAATRVQVHEVLGKHLVKEGHLAPEASKVADQTEAVRAIVREELRAMGIVRDNRNGLDAGLDADDEPYLDLNMQGQDILHVCHSDGEGFLALKNLHGDAILEMGGDGRGEGAIHLRLPNGFMTTFTATDLQKAVNLAKLLECDKDGNIDIPAGKTLRIRSQDGVTRMNLGLETREGENEHDRYRLTFHGHKGDALMSLYADDIVDCVGGSVAHSVYLEALSRDGDLVRIEVEEFLRALQCLRDGLKESVFGR